MSSRPGALSSHEAGASKRPARFLETSLAFAWPCQVGTTGSYLAQSPYLHSKLPPQSKLGPIILGLPSSSCCPMAGPLRPGGPGHSLPKALQIPLCTDFIQLLCAHHPSPLANWNLILPVRSRAGQMSRNRDIMFWSLPGQLATRWPGLCLPLHRPRVSPGKVALARSSHLQ